MAPVLVYLHYPWHPYLVDCAVLAAVGYEAWRKWQRLHLQPTGLAQPGESWLPSDKKWWVEVPTNLQGEE